MTDFYMRPLDMKNGAVDLTHGAGGRATAQLINDVFGRHFTNAWLDEGHDGALLPPMNRPVAVSCDGHVVRPLFFPGGDIGRLSVAGTVNDVAMCGARPLYLTASFILEEGFPLKDLDAVVASMAKTCEEAGVAIVTGDTKVVERGHGDGVYIAISGIGEKISEGTISGRAARPGDAVLISGTMGDHGTAILSFREGMSFGTTVESDCAPLNKMVEAVLSAAPHVHVLRDPTRGGLAATLNEIASQSNVGILLEESTVPVRPEVRSACEFLGLYPLYVANEGKMIVIVPEDEADAALAAMRASPYGENAARIGRVTDDSDVPVGMVEIVTLMGGRRTVDWLAGEQLPRIC